jgi:predicted Zn-dependent protease
MPLFAILLLLLQDRVVTGPAVNGYVNRICHKVSPGANVRLIVDSDVRAGTSPGGGIYLLTGLFSRLQNEAELAGVMAHQLAHVTAGTSCIRFVHIVHSDIERQDDRENERNADQSAIRMLTKAGYDPAAMLDFFSKYRRAGTDLPHAFSAEDLIIERLQIEATDHPLKDPVLDTPEFGLYHLLVTRHPL